MRESRQLRTAIAKDVRRAFADVVLGDGISLREGRLLDDDYHPSAEQLAAARAKNLDSQWTEVPAREVHEFSDAMTFLDSPGRKYYLPAFMVFALDPPNFDEGGVEEGVIQTLANLDRYRHEFESYTDDQKAAVARFLRYMIDEQGAYVPTEKDVERSANGCDDGFTENAIEVAFNEYWSRFMSDPL